MTDTPHVLQADVLVSSGKGTGTVVGRVTVDGPLSVLEEEQGHYDAVLALAHQLAAASSKGDRGIATINFINFWLDGLRTQLVARVVEVYGNGTLLILHRGEDRALLTRKALNALEDRERREREFQRRRKTDLLTHPRTTRQQPEETT